MLAQRTSLQLSLFSHTIAGHFECIQFRVVMIFLRSPFNASIVLLIGCMMFSLLWHKPVLSKDNHQSLGPYEVHYSVFNSTFLTPEVAKRYGIQRSNNVGIVNISILEKTSQKSTGANVQGYAYNLLGQQKVLAFKEIKDNTSTYYIAKFRFAAEEPLTFKLKVSPRQHKKTYDLSFSHKLYKEKK